jgi:exopolysaccharide production protein ExoQ
MLSKPVMYWFASGSREQADLAIYLDGNPIDRNIHVFLICVGLAVLLRRRLRWSTVFRQSHAVWLFYAFALLSVMWSDYPFVSLKRVIRELGNVVMILVVLTEPDELEAVRRVFVRCAVVLVPLSVLFIKYYPDLGRYYHPWTYEVQYAGVTTNKNSLGVLAMVSGLFLLWQLVESWKSRTLSQRIAAVGPEASVLLLCVWLLSIAHSATALACFTLASVVFVAGRRILAGLSVRWTVGLLTVAGLTGWLALGNADLRGLVAQSLGRDATLTTRTDIWAEALALRTNPLFGVGFASIWLTREGWALSQRLHIPHAHNGYLETYLNTGLIGVALLVAVLLLAVKQAARHLSARTSAGAVFVAVVLAGVVYNFTEVAFNNGNAVGLLLWLIAMCSPGLSLVRQDGLSTRLERKPKRLNRAWPEPGRRGATVSSFRPAARGDHSHTRKSVSGHHEM